MPEDKGRSILSRWLQIDAPWLRNPSPTAAGIVTAILGILGFGLIVVLLVLLARLFARVFGADIPTEELRNILIAIGALIGAPFLVWRTWVAHVAARANEEQAKIARENLYTTLFTKAVEQLGATREIKEGSNSKTEPNIEVRLGAIYALERIAQDSERDHWPIMETLCAYVRNTTRKTSPIPEEILSILKKNWDKMTREEVTQIEHYKAQLPPISPDALAALNVIGRRSASRRLHEHRLTAASKHERAYRIDLSGCHLRGVRLRGLNFNDSVLENVDFSWGDLSDSSFCGAEISGADLTKTVLRRTQLVGIDGEYMSFAWSELNATNFAGAEVWGADFSFARFYEADL